MVGSRGFFAVLGVATLLGSAAAEEQNLPTGPERADYVVVGRPITAAPDPVAAIRDILADIAGA